MALLIPPEVDLGLREEQLFPFLRRMEREGERLFESNWDVRERVETIYQILEVLAAAGSLDRSLLFRRVCCLDVGSAPEAVVFSQLGCAHLTVTEMIRGRPQILDKLPPVEYLTGIPDDVLARMAGGSSDLVLMLNACTGIFCEQERRAQFVSYLAAALSPGGQFILTADGIGVTEDQIQVLAGEVENHPQMKVVLPSGLTGEGGVVRRLQLLERVLGFDSSRLQYPPMQNHHDDFILVATKDVGGNT